MTRTVVRMLFPVLLSSAGLAQGDGPQFEAVSIKRNTSGARSSSVGTRPDLAFDMTNVALVAMVTAAYPTRNTEVVGAPDWLQTERYDVAAKANGKPSDEDVRLMLRHALRERMALTAHVEAREIPIYAMVVARAGHPGLHRSVLDCDAIRAARNAAARSGAPPSPVPGMVPQCGYSWSDAIRSGGVAIDTLARMISGIAGRVVLDRTDLEGRYEFTLRFSPPATSARAPDDPPDLFTALQEQLGLKLEAQRAPVDTLVIDHVERPDEN